MATTKKTKKAKTISPLHRRLVDIYLSLNCHLTAAANACGISLTAAVAAMKRPEVKAYLESRQDALTEAMTVSTTEILSTLVSQMRADIADILPDEPILRAAKAAGVSHLVKKIKVKEQTDKEGATTRSVEIEIYSSQEAAKALAKMFRLGGDDDLQRVRTAIKLYCEMNNCDPETAIVALLPHFPAVAKVRDEFLRPRWPEEIDAGEGEGAP